MKRRDFLKKTAMASSLLGIGLISASTSRGQQPERVASGKEYRIDSYCHFSMMSILDFLEKASNGQPHIFRNLFANTPTLIGADSRLALMDACGIDLSVLVPLPWLEATPPVYANPRLCAQAARLFNDELAAIVNKRPDRFVRRRSPPHHRSGNHAHGV